MISSKDSYEWISSLVIEDDNISINYAIYPDHPERYPDIDINNLVCVDTCTRGKIDPFKYVVSKNLPQMAELMLSTGYKPKEFEMSIGLEGIKDEEKNRPLKLSGWAYLGNYENYEPMLEVFMKYDLPNAPTKEQLKDAYGECYDNYLHYKGNWIDGYMINNKRPFYVNMAIKNLEKYCTDPNGTFQDARSFIAWANEQNKVDAIYSMRRANRLSYIDNRTNNKKLKINQ